VGWRLEETRIDAFVEKGEGGRNSEIGAKQREKCCGYSLYHFSLFFVFHYSS